MKTKTQKVLLAAILFTMAATAFAVSGSGTFNVVDRKKNGSFDIVPVTIEGMYAPDRFETDHFRVVWKKEEETLTLDRIDQIVKERETTEKDNPLWVDRSANDIRMMAANVLYHAEKAYSFWANTLGSPQVKALEKITLRLDLTNRYSEFAHYANDNLQPQYNNALSVAGGKPFKPTPGLNPWNREIWFRPKKAIPVGDILAQLPEDPANSQLREARAALYPMEIDQTVRDTLYAVFNNHLTSEGFINEVARQGGTLLLFEGAFQVLKVVNRILIPQHFYIDTAYVPEIIYHEFSHIAMSDFMQPDVSTPVNEGMADFFAASTANSPKLAKKIKEYSTATGKNGKKKQLFQIEFESTGKAQSDFVLSLLWGLRDKMGPQLATQLVFGARKYLNTKDSDIRTGLTSALQKSCDEVCPDPLNDKLKLNQYMVLERGL